MKRSTITLALLLATTATSAYADNADVENAIKRRADLSTFYQALINTGVNHELQPGTSYTVFAPTNEAMATIRQEQYPCFYESACREIVAEIVRNHIVAENVYVEDTAHQRGGVYTIGGSFVNIGEPYRNDYAVEGNNVTYMSSFGGGILYKIDGVIASSRELASLQYPEYAYMPGERVVTTTEKTIADPACGPGGCPDAVSQTTTITSTVMNEPALEPAR